MTMVLLALLALPVGLLLLAGLVYLQFRLSKSRSRFPGLILPCITFLFSLLMLLNMMVLPSLRTTVILSVATLLLTNIPTAVFLGIYFVCRSRIKEKSQMEQMKIKDLG